MDSTTKSSEYVAQLERVRQAVIRRGGSVTVGDIMSETGLGFEESKSFLNALMVTHEGTMRVSESGELDYAFDRRMIRRDYRSWWQRNKAFVLRILKLIAKGIIFAVLVIYFVIYLVILTAILTAMRNNNSSRSNDGFSLNMMIWFFWGGGGDQSSFGRTRRKPLYTSVYDFVFGPEEEKLDPLDVKTRCAQLIRAKRGVITAEDWMLISGQSREVCESELAQYTAEFEGEAEITNDGTLVYVFPDMMKSRHGASQMPTGAWEALEHPRPLSGNVDGGDGFVIALNIFNLLMAGVCTYALNYPLQSVGNDGLYYTYTLSENLGGGVSIWLGIFPLVFSALIFGVPLCRLPSNIKENRRRRAASVYKAVVGELALALSAHTKPTQIDTVKIIDRVNLRLARNGLEKATNGEIHTALSQVCEAFDGEVSMDDSTIVLFSEYDRKLAAAEVERDSRKLDQQELGRAVFSTDNDEQSDIEDDENRAELDRFSRELARSQGTAQYDSRYSDSRSAQNRRRSDEI